MTTIPCFAACATARAELPEGKFKYTVGFWLASSYVIGCIIYTVGAFVWPVAIWLVVAGLVTTFIVLRNTGKFDILSIFKKRTKKE
jgi:uncharacterized membrane protein